MSTSVAVKDINKLTIQISTPRTKQAALDAIWAGTSCPIDSYVDGVASTVGIEDT